MSETEQILKQIAKEHHTTVDTVRREIEQAMQAAQASPDPAIRAKWAAIPKKGKALTLEEFLDFLAFSLHPFS